MRPGPDGVDGADTHPLHPFTVFCSLTSSFGFLRPLFFKGNRADIKEEDVKQEPGEELGICQVFRKSTGQDWKSDPFSHHHHTT